MIICILVVSQPPVIFYLFMFKNIIFSIVIRLLEFIKLIPLITDHPNYWSHLLLLIPLCNNWSSSLAFFTCVCFRIYYFQSSPVCYTGYGQNVKIWVLFGILLMTIVTLVVNCNLVVRILQVRDFMLPPTCYI